MRLHRLAQIALTVAITFASVSCSDNTAPGPTPVIGATLTPKGATSVMISFTSVAGDVSYDIERAEGTTGTFAAVTTVAAPTTGGAVSYTDVGLKASTLYRYHVLTNRGGAKSAASAEVTATTLAFGNTSAVINGDITANRTLYADTAYTLSGFIHVANGATSRSRPERSSRVTSTCLARR